MNIIKNYFRIYATETGEDNDRVTTRAKLVTDKKVGLIELPHLAVVIKCYINSLVSGSWSAWAGDFATAVKEVYANCEQTLMHICLLLVRD